MAIERSDPHGAVLVVGGGVGGMRAAIDLAEAGLQVYLVESGATLGGRVAQLGYMFPTHDCVLCRGTSDHGYGCTRPAISPAFMDKNVHPNMELMTRTEIVDVAGSTGDFTITLRHEPRYVRADRCTNCGLCAVACPVHLPSEFQESLVTQKAIHKSAPRSLPDAYYIDKGGYCEGCGRCVEVCPTDAIDLDEEPWQESVRVSAIILALGYTLSDASAMEEYGYGRYPNVIHSMQYERYVSRSGPTEGLVLRPSDNKPPRRIAWLQCVGSRDQTHPYCSSICCMYATKEAVLAKQRVEGVDCRVFMMDERAFNKEFNAYFRRSKHEFGIDYVRCRISEVQEDPVTRDLILHYPGQDGRVKEEHFDMVVLSVGVRPPKGAEKLARMMKFDLNGYGFCSTDTFSPLETSQPGIYVCGAFSSPKEIAETITDAAGAAGDVMRLFHDELGKRPSSREFPFLCEGADRFPPERDIAAETPRVGVFVCECEPSINGIVDVGRVVERSRAFPHVVHAARVGYGCFPEGVASIKDAIGEQNLNRVVIGACSHRTHEPLFQRTIREAGLNASLMEMTNIREQCAWVHSHEPEKATHKATELVRVAAARAAALQPIYKMTVDPARRALVIGGGVSGLTAALAIADAGYEVTLVERNETLGGNLHNIYYVVEGYSPPRLRRDLVNRVWAHDRITIYVNTEVVAHMGHVGNYRAILRQRGGGEVIVAHGVTVVATGGQEAQRSDRYLLGQHPRVITQLELEEAIAHRLDEIAALEEVVMIQCVRPEGSRLDYCSRVCCTSTIKNAMRIKVANPDCQVTVLYKDITTYGFREKFYTEARGRGVIFVRYDDEHEPVVESLNGQVRVRVQEPNLGRPMTMEPDLLVLSMAIQPAEGTSKLAELLGVPLSLEGFFQEAHIKMRPMDFMEDGIFVCGMAHYPKFIEESISQALATAGRAMTILSKQPLFMGGTVAVVDQDSCVGCLTCVRTCPFEIPRIDTTRRGVGNIAGAAHIDPTLCQGCGTCTAECPATAIQLVNYSDEQLLGALTGVLGSWVSA